MEQLKNKTVLITGGNSGIGSAIAKEFVGRQAKVIITGRRKEALEAAAAAIGATPVLSDQSSLADLDRLADEIERSFGKLDILVINAGVAYFSPIEQTTERQFDEMMNINFKGAFFTLQKLLPLLNNGASVVMISSNSAAMTRPNSAAYSASKAALNMLMRTAALELGPRRIRVNAVSPGPTHTEIMSKFGLDEATLEGMKEKIIGSIPMGKIGVPEDVAKMVVYLSDNATSSFITGADFFIDGGMAV